MTTPLSLLARRARLHGLREDLDAGGAQIEFYTGTPPSEPDLAAAETLLATMALAAPCGALGQVGATQTARSLATLTLTVPQTVLAVASGVIGWLRLTNGAEQGFIDLPVGLVGSGAPALVNAVQVFTGGEIQLVSCVLAE